MPRGLPTSSRTLPPFIGAAPRKNGSSPSFFSISARETIAAEHHGGGLGVAHVQGVALDQAAENAFAAGVLPLLRADDQQAAPERVAQRVVGLATDLDEKGQASWG